MRQLPTAIVALQPPIPSQLSLVHASPSLQTYVVPAQSPFEHSSSLVQGLPSSHSVPTSDGLQVEPLMSGRHM